MALWTWPSVRFGNASGVSGGGGLTVISYNGRTGIVVSQAGDYDALQVGALAANGVTVSAGPASSGLVLTSTSTSAASWQAAAGGLRVINDQVGTTYTIQASDHGKVVRGSNASAQTYTIPDGLSVGTELDVIAAGAGLISFVMGGSETLNNPGLISRTRAQHSRVTLLKTASTMWNLSGDLG